MPDADQLDRRGYAKGRQRRTEILDVAVRHFSEVGYRSASLREVAQRAGISHAGLLHHFPSKAHLLAAVLDRRDEEDDTRHGISAATGRDALRALVALAADNAAHPELVRLFAILSAEATAADHPAHAYFRDRYAQLRATLTRALTEVDADGGLRPGVDPAGAAVGVIAVMDGVQVQWLLAPDAVDMAAALAGQLGAVLREPL